MIRTRTFGFTWLSSAITTSYWFANVLDTRLSNVLGCRLIAAYAHKRSERLYNEQTEAALRCYELGAMDCWLAARRHRANLMGCRGFQTRQLIWSSQPVGLVNVRCNIRDSSRARPFCCGTTARPQTLVLEYWARRCCFRQTIREAQVDIEDASLLRHSVSLSLCRRTTPNSMEGIRNGFSGAACKCCVAGHFRSRRVPVSGIVEFHSNRCTDASRKWLFARLVLDPTLRENRWRPRSKRRVVLNSFGIWASFEKLATRALRQFDGDDVFKSIMDLSGKTSPPRSFAGAISPTVK